MCGIVGYIGKRDAVQTAFYALKRMEYRGYDSYGVAALLHNKATVFKRVGKIADTEHSFLAAGITGDVVIGHSRWATTGAVTEANAHPHTDCHDSVYVVHNGIIENYKSLKKELIGRGHVFRSDTDTEVIAHMIEEYSQQPLEVAVGKILPRLRGAYGLLVVSTHDPGKIVAARMSSPVIIGVGNNEVIAVSDPNAFVTITRNMIVLEDGEIAVLSRDGVNIIKNGRIANRLPEVIDWDAPCADRGEYAHYMLKEIFEIPETIENAIAGRLVLSDGVVKLGGIESAKSALRNIDHITCIGCGTAYYAAMIGKYLFEDVGKMTASADIASELRYRNITLPDNTAVVSISQSGETADTLEALRELKKQGVLTVGITNVVGSSQARETDCGIYTRTGPEMAVASTKAFIGQVTTLAMLSLYMGRQRGVSYTYGENFIRELQLLPKYVRMILNQSDKIKSLAEDYSRYKKYWFIGRNYNYPIAMESAWKFREISYIPSGADAGGELKHGSLAIVDEDTVVVAICPGGNIESTVYQKMLSNIDEVTARGGNVIKITDGDACITGCRGNTIVVPETIEPLSPILSVIPSYLFSYYVANALGRDIDKPRNLAKSVTVE